MIRQHRLVYSSQSMQEDAEWPVDAQTPWQNIVVVTGSHMGYSSDAQVQPELEVMLSEGVRTDFIGFGPAAATAQVQAELQAMAQWAGGSVHSVADSAELADAIGEIVNAIPVDPSPCCASALCEGGEGGDDLGEPDPVPSDESEAGNGDTPTTNEPDPVPADEEESDSEGTTTDTESDSGDEFEGGGEIEDGNGEVDPVPEELVEASDGCACSATRRGSSAPWLLLLAIGIARRPRSKSSLR